MNDEYEENKKMKILKYNHTFYNCWETLILIFTTTILYSSYEWVSNYINILFYNIFYLFYWYIFIGFF